MLKRIENVLDAHVRPLLNAHRGDIKVLSFEDGTVKFKLEGQCAGCPSAHLTTEELIQGALTEHIPEVKQAVLVNHVSDELLDQARTIIRSRNEKQV